MRARGQSPLLPYTTAHKLPHRRSQGLTAASRIIIAITLVIIVLYGIYSVVGPSLTTQDSSTTANVGTGRGLTAHGEAAQVGYENVLDFNSERHTKEVAQLQTQGSGHEKSPETHNNAVNADTAGQGAENAAQLHKFPETQASGIYSMIVDDIDGKEVKLSKYMGKVSLIVNVASQCGYTDSNYKGLQALYEKYSASGFEVLAFPCNSFGQQEPGSSQDIKDFVKFRYGANFPLFQKVEVLGPQAHPVFRFLEENLPASQKDFAEAWKAKWNFSKWLVNREGVPVKHYDSVFDQQQLEQDIAAELNNIALS